MDISTTAFETPHPLCHLELEPSHSVSLGAHRATFVRGLNVKMGRLNHIYHMIPMPAGHQLEAIHRHGNLPAVKNVPIPERKRLAIFCHPWSFLGGQAQDP
jgi:hypothetical protein